MNGIFTISLDFELHWGGFEKWPLSFENEQSRITPKVQLESYKRYFLNTRNVIPKMLELFEKHEIHVTWATVGMLLHQSKEQLIENMPELKPTYLNRELSAYEYIDSKGIGDNEDQDPYHFSPTLVNQILRTPNQELGTHSYSHFYCNEGGQTVEQFREDLRAAKRSAAIYDVSLHSLVFPRNQFNDEYLKVCFQEGIKSVRSNPMDWFWKINSTQQESKWKRLNRGLDAYFPFGKKNTYKLDEILVIEGLPLCLPASRLLRPYRPSELFLNEFKITRIKAEMERASKNREIYHLWWHPHNFGTYPDQSLRDLERILQHYRKCRDQYGMVSLTMKEIADLIYRESGKSQTS